MPFVTHTFYMFLCVSVVFQSSVWFHLIEVFVCAFTSMLMWGFTVWVLIWIMACMDPHSLMPTCINVRADALQWLSAELCVTLLLTDPLKLLLFRGLIGCMQIWANFKGRVKGLKGIKEPAVWKWKYTHPLTHKYAYIYSTHTQAGTNISSSLYLLHRRSHTQD